MGAPLAHRTAVVRRIVSPGVAEIALLRQTECALSCKDCEGCPQKPERELIALADDPVGASPGDVVEVRSAVGSPARAALLICLPPCAALILGWLLGAVLAWGEGGRILASFALLPAGFLPARLADRAAHGRREFTVTSVRR